jgi:hypothetical protein
MRISRFRRVRQPPSPRGFSTICRFDFEPTAGVAVFNCTLVRAPDGKVFIYGPVGRDGTDTLSLAPDVRRLVIEQALAAIGMESDDRIAA